MMIQTQRLLKGFTLGVSLSVASMATAAVSISLDAEKLGTGDGSAMPTSGLLLLVASTADDSFSLPTADEFVPASSDDAILAAWDLADGGGVAGVFSGMAANLSYDAEIDAGDPLMLYWFPGSTKSSSSPGASARFGLFRDDDGIRTGSVWELPADGTLLYSLKFFTNDATEVADGGTLPGYAGSASLPLGVALAPVSAPTGVSATNQADGVRVQWIDAANNEAGYLIERSIEGSGIWLAVGSAYADGTSFVDGTTAEKTRYQYRVTALNNLAKSTEVVSAALLTSFGRISNISTRGQVLTGGGILIGGFVIEGSADKKVLIRAIGPQLGVFSVGGALADSTLELFRISDPADAPPFATNVNWADNANSEEIISVTASLGAFPLEADGKDSVLLMTLAPGGYTAKVAGADGLTGVGLVEIYDADAGESPSDVVNISTRGNIGVDADILIAGFVIDGDRDKTVLVRGIGPTLGGFGVEGTIVDPVLEIVRNVGGGVTEDVALNDNWEEADNAADIPAASQVVGGFPLEPGSADAAILITLPPGIYNAKLSGVGGLTGNGLIEVYRVP